MSTTAIDNAAPRSVVAWRWLAGALAVAFGIATLAEGGHVLFGGSAAHADAGDVVPFVLLFNFSAGFLYVLGGIATLAQQPVTVWIARTLAVATLAVFVAFIVHILRGGVYEIRTVLAMSLRSAFWVTQALTLPMLLRSGMPLRSGRKS